MRFGHNNFARPLLAFILFTLLLGTAPKLCADGKEDAEKIEKYRQELLKIDNPEVKDIDLGKAPDLGKFDDIKKSLYKNTNQLGKGQDAAVYEAASAIDRPDIDIKAGDKMAVRAAQIGTKNEIQSGQWTLRNLIRAEKLREKGICEFFPRFYSSYEAYGQVKYQAQNLNVQEMELIDATLGQQFDCGENWNWKKKVEPMSDCFALEFCLGEWAGAYFGDIGSNDAKVVNAGVKKVDYSRSYEIQGKEYVFPKSELRPVRIDIGGAIHAGGGKNAQILKSYGCSLQKLTSTSRSQERCETSKNAQAFLSRLLLNKEEGKSVFDIFGEFYDQAKCKEGGKSENNMTFTWPKIEMEKK